MSKQLSFAEKSRLRSGIKYKEIVMLLLAPEKGDRLRVTASKASFFDIVCLSGFSGPTAQNQTSPWNSCE